MAARVYQVRRQRLPLVGVFFMPLTIQYLFGIPKSGYYHTRQIDVRRNVQLVVGETPQARFDFMSQIGLHGSYLEGSVLDQLFGQTWMPGRSTTQVLREAAQHNLPIYTVTPTNLPTVLPQLSLTADVREEIVNAVSTGKTVVIPQRDVTQGRWVGTGYIIQDPVTGAGAYLIDGGYNGGSWEGCTITVKGSAGGFTLDPLIGMRKRLLFDWFEEEQNRFKANWMSALAAAKQLTDYARAVAKINTEYTQLFDNTVKAFVGALTALNQQPLYSGGSACVALVAKKSAGDETVQSLEAYFAFKRKPETHEYEDGVAVDFDGQILTGCLDPRWDFGDGDMTAGVATTQHLFTETGQYEVALTVACPRTISKTGEVIREDLTGQMKVFIVFSIYK